jgi:molybdopterin-binding protein
LSDIIRRDAITVIMATHDMSQGQKLADRIAVIIDGRIIQVGRASEIFYSPKDSEVARFVGMENVIDGEVVANDGEMATVDISGVLIEAVSELSAGEKVSVGIRPEDITLASSKLASSARNSLEGSVNWVASSGPLCRVQINCGFPLVALVTRRSTEELGLEKGRQVYATFKAVNIHLIKRR